MSLVFPYTTLPTQNPIWTLQGRQNRPRPVMFVAILGPKGTAVEKGLLDTGADDTVFPDAIATAIGIDLSQAPTGVASGVGATRPLVLQYAEVVLLIGSGRRGAYGLDGAPVAPCPGCRPRKGRFLGGRAPANQGGCGANRIHRWGESRRAGGRRVRRAWRGGNGKSRTRGGRMAAHFRLAAGQRTAGGTIGWAAGQVVGPTQKELGGGMAGAVIGLFGGLFYSPLIGPIIEPMKDPDLEFLRRAAIGATLGLVVGAGLGLFHHVLRPRRRRYGFGGGSLPYGRRCHRLIEDWHIEWYMAERSDLYRGLVAMDCPLCGQPVGYFQGRIGLPPPGVPLVKRS
jgi:hypothetical protein